MRGIGWVATVASAVLAGCFDIPQETLDDITCTDVCRCLSSTDEDTCKTQCVQFLTPVSQDCFDYASTYAQDCPKLLAAIDDGGVCEPPPDPEN